MSASLRKKPRQPAQTIHLAAGITGANKRSDFMSTQGEGIDMEQLYHDLAGVVIGHYLGDVNHATPMREIRRATEGAGAMIGRIFAVAEHEGLINANLLMEIRASEEDYKARLLHSARLFGPGQILRNHLEEVSARGGRHD